MVEWLEKESNFKRITGSAAISQNVVAGAKLTKVAAFSALEQYVNSKEGKDYMK